MRYILFIALLLPSFLWAQENVRKKNSIQIVTGIGIGSHISIPPVEGITTCTNRIESSNPGLNYRFGIDYQRQIKGGLSVKVGGRISLWSLNNINTTTDCYFLCCYGDCGYYWKEQTLNQYYMEMPVTLQYKFGNNKLQFYLEAGASPMLSILTNDYLINENSFSVAVQIGAGLSYQLSSNWSLFGQLSSRVQTKEMLDLHASYGHLYEIGLELGAGFAF